MIHNLSRYLHTAIANILAGDPLSLKFETEVEAVYLSEYFDVYVSRIRPGLLLGFIFYELFFFLDVLVLPDVEINFEQIQFWKYGPIILTIYFISHLQIYRRFHQLINTLSLLVFGYGIMSISFIFPIIAAPYYVGIILVLLYGYILLGLRIYWSSVSGWILCLSYVIVMEYQNVLQLELRLSNYFFLLGANILLSYAGYFMEVLRRKEFYTSYQLDLERKHIEADNLDLEARVENRTEQLLTEVEERKTAQREAQLALEQKELLLREAHHRTKNNMNVVVSLLNMQAMQQKLYPAEDAFLEVAERIFSMSLVHEQLYHSQDLSTIRFDQYLIELTRKLHQSEHFDPDTIKIEFDCQAIEIGLQEAVPLGLAVNEILSNAFKHGFEKRNDGLLQISTALNQAGNIEIEISNNGSEFPNTVSLDQPKTMGLKLINLLVKDQLQGSLALDTRNGVRYSIEIPVDHEISKL